MSPTLGDVQQRWSELGDLLRSRRARLEPRFELPGDQRRVPGLRREEVAAAAGVSVAYYTRLEQGRAPNVSDHVLAAVCRALDLGDAERAHAWRLARPGPQPSYDGSSEAVRPQVRALVHTLAPTPALVLGRDRHLLAWNVTAHALHAPHVDAAAVDEPETRPWWPALLFGDPRVAAIFVDWPTKARDTVSDLRVELGRRPHDDRLRRLVDELRAANHAFDELWAAYPIEPCAYHDRRYRIPDLGELTLHDEFLQLGDDNGQRLAIFTAAPGSPSAALLHQLAARLSAPSLPRSPDSTRLGQQQ
jgi:transcriptional regulator with XRE-family HTH domain